MDEAGRSLLLDYRQRHYAGMDPPVQGLSEAEKEKHEEEAVTHYPPELKQNPKVVVHFDLDCFYAQVEELLDPQLKGRPLGVTQKYLVVTCNYEARKRGVTKLMSTAEAKRKCPELQLRSGEDLTPYRTASRRVESILKPFGVVEKLGLDEFYVDVTALCQRRLQARKGSSTQFPVTFHGYVYSGAEASENRVTSDTSFRPQDLRSASKSEEVQNPSWQSCPAACSPEEVFQLVLASELASEARENLSRQGGFKASAGISVNKLLAKLAGGLHKPNAQTVLPFFEASGFLAPLPARVIRGVGSKAEKNFRGMGVVTCGDMRRKKLWQIKKHVTKSLDLARTFHSMSWGIDNTPIVPKGPPKSVTVEDSFKSLTCFSAASTVLKSVLVPDLLFRLSEDQQEYRRKPTRLVLTFRTTKMREKKHMARKSVSGPFPSLSTSLCHQEKLKNTQAHLRNHALVLNASMCLLRKALTEPFNLTLLNIGASNFKTQTSSAESILNFQMVDDSTDGLGDLDEAGDGHSAKKLKLEDREFCRKIARVNEMQRRDYGSLPGSSKPLMSKQQSRQLAADGLIPGEDFTGKEYLGYQAGESKKLIELWKGEKSLDSAPSAQPSAQLQKSPIGKATSISLKAEEVDLDILSEMPEEIRKEYERAGYKTGKERKKTAKGSSSSKPITNFFTAKRKEL